MTDCTNSRETNSFHELSAHFKEFLSLFQPGWTVSLLTSGWRWARGRWSVSLMKLLLEMIWSLIENDPRWKIIIFCSSIFSQWVTKIRYPSARSLPNLLATIPSLMVPGPSWLLQLTGEALAGSFMCGLYSLIAGQDSIRATEDRVAEYLSTLEMGMFANKKNSSQEW